MLHCVRGHGLLLDVLADNKSKLQGGMVHSFGSSAEVMERYVDLGMYISLSPSVLRLRPDRARALVGRVPWQRFYSRVTPQTSPSMVWDGESQPAYTRLPN